MQTQVRLWEIVSSRAVLQVACVAVGSNHENKRPGLFRAFRPAQGRKRREHHKDEALHSQTN